MRRPEVGHFSLERTAKGVQRKRLFEWFTDFSSEDVEIAKRRGSGTLISRQVRREGNRVHVDNQILSRGKPMNSSFVAELHPDRYYYETKGITPGMVEDTRRYKFTDSPGVGTTVHMDADYKLLRGGLKLIDAFGLVNRQMKQIEERLMNAFLAEAEEKLKS